MSESGTPEAVLSRDAWHRWYYDALNRARSGQATQAHSDHLFAHDAELRAEVERLAAERSDAERERDARIVQAVREARRREAAEARVAELTEALRKYGRHDAGCLHMMMGGCKCVCGLRALLGSPPSEDPN